MNTIELRWELMDNGRYAGYDDDTIIVWVYEEAAGCWCYEDIHGFNDGWYASAERAMRDCERWFATWYQPAITHIEVGYVWTGLDLDPYDN